MPAHRTACATLVVVESDVRTLVVATVRQYGHSTVAGLLERNDKDVGVAGDSMANKASREEAALIVWRR